MITNPTFPITRLTFNVNLDKAFPLVSGFLLLNRNADVHVREASTDGTPREAARTRGHRPGVEDVDALVAVAVNGNLDGEGSIAGLLVKSLQEVVDGLFLGFGHAGAAGTGAHADAGAGAHHGSVRLGRFVVSHARREVFRVLGSRVGQSQSRDESENGDERELHFE